MGGRRSGCSGTTGRTDTFGYMSIPVQRTTSETDTAAMSLRGLVKRFDTRLAVSGLSLEVPAGSFY